MIERIKQHFSGLSDPRSEMGRRHRLDEIIIIAILAVICSADSWNDVEEFAKSKKKWLKQFLELPHGIPSHDTFDRVFSNIKPESFEKCFMKWITALAKEKEKLIAIDGKTLRHSFDRASNRAAIHMISAWADTNKMVFGQLTTEAKSNEITAIPKLLEMLDISGATVTIDAMGCQKKIAKKIIKGGGNYILAVKGNQETLWKELKLYMDEAIAGKLPEAKLIFWKDEINKNHGRIENRRAWSSGEISWFEDREEWEGLKSFAVVEAERCIDGNVTKERRYYISSLPGDETAEIGRAIRAHWGIENQLHWSLDMSFNEDMSRMRSGYSAENFSRLRRMALNLLKKDKTAKVGIKGKRLKAGWDEKYLLRVLTG